MSPAPVRVTVFGKTDLGRTREHNEDTFLVADLSTGNASLQPDVRRHEIGPRGSLFMVADGMGGAAAGELASAMAADLIYRHMATAWARDPADTADQFAYRMREAVELARESLHPDLEWLGVVLNIADMRLVHSREALRSLQERFEDKVFSTVVRRSVRYAESAERGVSILDYAPDLGADYLALASETLERLGGFEEARERLAGAASSSAIASS